MLQRLLITAFLWLFLSTGMAQNSLLAQTAAPKEIQGVVFEWTEDQQEEPVIGATIRLLNPIDSTLISILSSNEQGKFRFLSVKPGDYLLSVSFLGFNTHYEQISNTRFKEKNNSIQLEKIKLEVSAFALSEVTITTTPPDVVVKEDTIEYNAAAFKTAQGAVAEDLLKRLPGVEVDATGNIKANGKDIKRVLVDGKEFFGDDPKMATKNIQVDVIDKVQVIDKKTKEAIRTGVDDGEKETVINLSIKKGMNKGWIGNADIGAGALVNNPNNESPRYASSVMLSKFVENDNVAFIFNSNNINNQGFSSGASFISVGGSSFGNSFGSGDGGIVNSSSVGLNISNSKNKKLKVDGGIRYGYTDNLSKNKTFGQNILADSISYSENRSESQRYSNSLGFNTSVEYKPDTLNTFTLEAGFNYNESNSRNNSYRSTMAGDIDSTMVNQSEGITTNSAKGLGANMSLTYSRRLSKKGRQFSIASGFNINQNNGDGTNHSLSQFFLQPERNKAFNQESTTNGNTNDYNFRITYIEPVWGEKNTLQFSYSISNNQTNNIRETYDYDPVAETYSILNPIYSQSLKNSYVNQRAGVFFNSYKDKFNYNIGFNLTPSYTQSTTFIKNGDSAGNDSILNRMDGRTIINYSPQARFSYRFPDKANMNFSYNGNSRQPTVSQLDPTVDNTNPLFFRSGNPDLLPSFSNRFTLNYSKYHQGKQQSLNLGLNFSFTQNEIISFTDYEETTGIQYSKPINENGSWNSSLYGMYNLPLDKKKRLRLGVNTNLIYDNRIGFIMINKKSERNVSGTARVGGNISLSYSTKWFYGQLMGNINYNNTTNSLEGQKGMKSTSLGLNYNTSISLPKDWGIYSETSYRGNRGLSVGYNTNNVLWNMEINKKLLSKKQATIRLKWNDILQDNITINRNVTANYIEDSEYNALSSYFLIAFAYRFNQMGEGKARRTIVSF